MNKRWPAAIAVAGAAWYASESLRHRREQGDGYTLDGEALEVGTPEFLRACEELTAAAATEGSHAEVLVNGDAIFPAYLETIRQAESTINCLTYVYWRGDIAREVARALADRARDGLDVNLLLDAVGTAKMERDLLDDLRDAGVTVARFRPPRPYAVRRLNNRTHRKLLAARSSSRPIARNSPPSSPCGIRVLSAVCRSRASRQQIRASSVSSFFRAGPRRRATRSGLTGTTLNPASINASTSRPWRVSSTTRTSAGSGSSRSARSIRAVTPAGPWSIRNCSITPFS